MSSINFIILIHYWLYINNKRCHTLSYLFSLLWKKYLNFLYYEFAFITEEVQNGVSKKDDEIFRKTFFDVKSLTETSIICWETKCYQNLFSVTKYFFFATLDTRLTYGSYENTITIKKTL